MAEFYEDKDHFLQPVPIEETTRSDLTIRLWAKPDKSLSPDVVTIEGKLQSCFIEVHIYTHYVVFVTDGKNSPQFMQDSRAFIENVKQRDFDLDYIKSVLNMGRDRGYL